MCESKQGERGGEKGRKGSQSVERRTDLKVSLGTVCLVCLFPRASVGCKALLGVFSIVLDLSSSLLPHRRRGRVSLNRGMRPRACVCARVCDYVCLGEEEAPRSMCASCMCLSINLVSIHYSRAGYLVGSWNEDYHVRRLAIIMRLDLVRCVQSTKC